MEGGGRTGPMTSSGSLLTGASKFCRNEPGKRFIFFSYFYGYLENILMKIKNYINASLPAQQVSNKL